MIKLSATIITLNEEENLSRCLNSLQGLVDEVIIVDSGSKDKTLDIAKEYKTTVFYRKFDNFANQKNFALEKARGEWIFSIDADEVVPSDLGSEIQKAIKSEDYQGYLIPRRNFILGAEIKHSRWSPDKHIWLWKKVSGRWSGEVHEEVIINGKVGEIKTGKLHYQDRTTKEFISSNKLYAKLLAEKLVEQGKNFSVVRFFWDPFFEFSIRFIYKKGFLDGWRGLVLAALMAFYKMDVWLNVLKIKFAKD